MLSVVLMVIKATKDVIVPREKAVKWKSLLYFPETISGRRGSMPRELRSRRLGKVSVVIHNKLSNTQEVPPNGLQE